jgi:hypothetical protein
MGQRNPRNHHSWLVETPTKSWNVYHLSTKRLVETLQIILNNGMFTTYQLVISLAYP